MLERHIAPYGSWSSPITSDLIVASTIGLSGILLDGADVYWLESRPQENGRSVIVRRAADGSSADVTPPVASEATFSVRTRVHEYGGGSYLVSGGDVHFCNDADQRLYRQELGGTPVAITPEPARPKGLRYADGVMDVRRGRMIWVREDHTTAAPEPVSTLVEMPLDGLHPQRVLQSGRDFYAAPRLSPDGSQLAWLEWSHPNMPWIGCELWVGECAADGSVSNKRLVAGGEDESIFQPEWSPDGRLYFISDRAQPSLEGRWWNLFRVRGDALDRSASVESVYPLAAEFGRAQWVFRLSTFAFASASRLVCSYVQDGVHRMSTVDLASLEPRPIATEYEDISFVRATADRVYFAGGSPTTPTAVVELHPPSGRAKILKLSTTQDVEAYRKYLSVPEPVMFDTDNGHQAHGLFYPRKTPISPPPPARLRRCSCTATADRPRPRPRPSVGGRNIGPAAASPFSTSITAAARGMAASTGFGCRGTGE